ncbi:hypothetical protein BCR33DRAFT_805625 [Rhizoclosmatium globosum]|uniref:G domain-containing protein n=1 Tax=Rhizoclosmatium globosum TaxID=329046 RepID=A0A1Y2CMV5_9FUNG|nr:hypothetical protein BCR33DRAFT_805625 [Rhizoclosmatium globosum]|eukprot:ORY48332.1 hypothetical protein BCR33DRAFT_805625 [Rhizoclosmatium globosum]
MTNTKLTYHIIGNPGSGKSTLINTVFQAHKCNSGDAKGRNTTETKACQMDDGNEIVDTMGLADLTMRKEAAEGITSSLKANQHMKVVFVIEGTRLQAQDAQSVCDVIGSITIPHKDIHYGIILNKMPKSWSQADYEDVGEELLAGLTFAFEELDKLQAAGQRPGMDATDTSARNKPVIHYIPNQAMQVAQTTSSEDDFDDLVGEVIAIKCLSNNKWACATSDKGLYFSAPVKDAWERFILQDVGGGKFAIKSVERNLQVCAEKGHKCFNVSRDHIQEWETFTLTGSPRKFTLATEWGEYMSVQNEGVLVRSSKDYFKMERWND